MCIGNSPVPIVAWVAGVIEGDEPTSAFAYHTPSGISAFSSGQSSGNSSSTLIPPASHTSVTMSLGGVEGVSISGRARPSTSGKPKSRSSACVGAMSAMVTGRSTSPSAGTTPGPYQNSGTSCR